MNELVALAFDDERTADEGLLEITRLAWFDTATVVDASIAIKTKRGKLRIRQTTEISTSHRTVTEGWWGLLITLLIGGPIGGLYYGDAYSMLDGKLDQFGIKKDFVANLSETMEPGHSAVFLLTGKELSEIVLDDIDGLGARSFRTPFPERSVTAIGQALLVAGRDSAATRGARP